VRRRKRNGIKWWQNEKSQGFVE